MFEKNYIYVYSFFLEMFKNLINGKNGRWLFFSLLSQCKASLSEKFDLRLRCNLIKIELRLIGSRSTVFAR